MESSLKVQVLKVQVISLPDASTGAKETVLSQIFVVNQSIFFASGLNCCL